MCFKSSEKGNDLLLSPLSLSSHRAFEDCPVALLCPVFHLSSRLYIISANETVERVRLHRIREQLVLCAMAGVERVDQRNLAFKHDPVIVSAPADPRSLYLPDYAGARVLGALTKQVVQSRDIMRLGGD